MDISNTKGSIWLKWDLHMHSTASDGKCSPQELIEEASKRGISVIALTDHHTVNNIDEAKRLGKEKGITVISGIEFRTTYGQKSVHMIGLFPDKYNGISLNQETLYELILCQLNLSKTTIMQAARNEAIKSGKVIEDDNVAYKDGLLRVQVSFESAANLIHQYGGIVTVHAGGKTNSLDEEMKHEGSSKKNVPLVDSLGPVKEDLLKHYVDICEVTKPKEAPFYLKTFRLPSIAASDAHKINDFYEPDTFTYTWIKAEPTFEGLRQILFEPSSRVKIQTEEPESKSDYLVIDSLHINHQDFGIQTIPFNQGLNTIIGGRSSGKSILLGCIARLSGNHTAIKPNKKEYDAYIDQISKNMSITWRDHATEGIRKVEYFPQSHIIEMASNKKAISELSVRILRANTNWGEKIDCLKDKLLEHTGSIHSIYAQFQALQQEIINLSEALLSLGNKDGIEKEIEKIQAHLDSIKLSMAEKISEQEEAIVAEQNQQLAAYERSRECALKNIKSLELIRDINLIVDISDKFMGIDAQIRAILTGVYGDIRTYVSNRWQNSIDNLILAQKQAANDYAVQIEEIKANPTYCKAQALYSKNQEFVMYSTRLDVEKGRYGSILGKEAEIRDKKEKLAELRERLIIMHRQFFTMFSEFCNSVSMERDNIKIYPYIAFKQTEYTKLVTEAFDGRPTANHRILQYEWNPGDEYTDYITDVFDGLISEQFTLRKGVSAQDIAGRMIAFNGFSIQYNVTYQGDNLDSMSEGKMAFVVLRMLLDFSENDCPILIDQPEDDLDNRAIYSELVQYLRAKKTQRQIILVTHNPNVVVGADAEEIIVANQHGNNCPNPNKVKFAYRTGALEDSFKNNDVHTLLCQGIREHVCDILEGGNEAFHIRESKYQLSS